MCDQYPLGVCGGGRELRDRFLEHLYARALLPEGKYDVSRRIQGVRPEPQRRLLAG